ncbi:MAG: hypothetical protein NVS4B3_06840 [Gemmatimonadaceae bacterium]
MSWPHLLLAGAFLVPSATIAQQPVQPTPVTQGPQKRPAAQPVPVAKQTKRAATAVRTDRGEAVGSTLRAAIDAANKKAIEAFNRGDVAAFMSVYAEDAWVLPPNAPTQKGRAAITEHWQGGWKMGVRNIKLTTVELRAQGDMAYEVGTYQLDVQPPEGASPGAATAQDHGKYVVIWKRSAGKGWQWYRDCYNSDVPPAATKS